ncbi:MAG TPA: SDR family NAD(P)-dependent oxidoreductase, partial [Acidimicrobiales bacterium]|nr:SDR family NAD(P)-dependent oxidoreductase [Acidimicrobiales bacterium]
MAPVPAVLARAVDTALEVTIAGSFSRLGIAARRATSPWPDPPGMEGRTVLITGASSGLGRAAAVAMAGLGATVWMAGRDRVRLDAAVGEADRAGAARGGSGRAVVADVVEPDQAGRLVDEVTAGGRLDAVVHNAGALFADLRRAPDGTELTVATHVLAP